MIVLKRIRVNKYHFIESESRAAFEVYLEKYRDSLPGEYKIQTS